MPIDFLTSKAANPIAHLVLAHGAMAPMDSPFMTTFCGLLQERTITVSRFEFAYMAGRRNDGKKSPPPRAEKLLDEYCAAIDQIEATSSTAPLLIGGKSLGGRVASMIADRMHGDQRIAGLVCVGYPFHPPKKPQQLRTAHLESMACPTLILQGERDPFGTSDEITSYTLDRRIHFHWLSDGDHDFSPRRSSGHTRQSNLESAADAVHDFAHKLAKQSQR